jgi:hypothetical protein
VTYKGVKLTGILKICLDIACCESSWTGHLQILLSLGWEAAVSAHKFG